MRIVLLTSASFILFAVHAAAQVAPGETPGDTGYVLLNGDTLIVVRCADGHAWLQQNMGAVEVATGTNGPQSYGDLYQWGRWTDGHQSRTSATAQASVLANNNPVGLGAGSPLFYIGADPNGWWGIGNFTDSWEGASAHANNGIDPCTAIGPGWQLPAQGDWTNILAHEGIIDATTALGSNLRLPLAGSRDGQTGTLINAGQFGNYWCSTPSGAYAKDLTIGSGFVNADDDALRSYGMSVRCLNRSLHIGIMERSHGSRPVIFPNPAVGEFTVNSTAIISTVIVRDARGRAVLIMPCDEKRSLVGIGDLPPGMYAVEVRTLQGTYHERLHALK